LPEIDRSDGDETGVRNLGNKSPDWAAGAPKESPYPSLRSALTDFTHLHHDGCVVMGRVGGERTAAHSDWLADQTAERGAQLFFSGDDVNRPRALDDIVGIIGIETGVGREPQNVRFLQPSGSISCPADCKLALSDLPLDVRFQALGGS
jgi:hypothetical protein